MIDIDISKALKQPGKPFPFSYCGTPELQGFAWSEPLELRAEYEVLDNGDIRIKGSFRAMVEAQCVRCLAEIKYRIDYNFDEIFVKQGTEEDEYVFSGETMELDKMVYDAITLDVPQQLLCKEGCLGLCSQCGANLNERKCDCKANDGDKENSPFAKLKDWI